MNPNTIEIYRALLSIRANFKQVQQISWQCNQLEKKFPLDLLNEKQQQELLDIYKDLIPQLEDILSQLKNEYGNKTNTGARK